MAELATSLHPVHITCKAKANVSFTRGLRGTIQSDNTYDLSAATERGQVTCETPTESAGGYFLGNNINGSAAIPAVASEAVAPGDVAYSAASGKTSKTSTNAVRVGMWRTTTAQDALGEIIPD